MKIAVSLLVCNDLVFLKPCIESLLKSDLNEHILKFFIIDNNSGIEMKTYLNTISREKWIKYNKTNEGIVIPRIEIMNKILEEGFDLTLEIHADMLFPTKWLHPLIELIDDQTAIAMPYILNNPNKKLTISEMNILVEKYKTNIITENVRQVHPWILNNAIIKKIGYYDPAYSPQRCEDDDFMYNIMKNSYKTKCTKQSIVVHYGGKTRSFINYDSNLLNNDVYFFNKNKITVKDLVAKFTLHPVITNY